MPRSADRAASAAPAEPAPTTTRSHALLAVYMATPRRQVGKARPTEPLRSAISDDTALKIGKVRAAYPCVRGDSPHHRGTREAGTMRIEIAGPRNVDEKLNGAVRDVAYKRLHLVTCRPNHT